jgi:hypothetical protein
VVSAVINLLKLLYAAKGSGPHRSPHGKPGRCVCTAPRDIAQRAKLKRKFELFFWRSFITVAVAGTDVVVRGVAVIAMIA